MVGSLHVGDFAVNDNHLVDLENPQMVRCIICKPKQTFEIDLTQRSILCRGLIK
jgi:hypothetical protein